MIKASIILYPILGFFFCLLHLILSFSHLWSYLIHQIQCLIIASRLDPKYQNLNLERLKYLAVVIDSEEAKNKKKINQLLLWLSNIGIKYVILYDIEGVLKKSNIAKAKSLDLEIEVLSDTDGKEAVVKAANYLFSNNSNQEPNFKFTENDLSNALKSVGHGGYEPDLLLVYGPARCHLGFPAWRLKYTEIVHMGSLKSMKYSATVKAIYDFSKKHQNYGK
ncbi:hypothetical protein LUZ60_005992 [Juncus effusus]|nr:hypothetical protein LUZ60_005992 [Juncus effusus]